MWTYFHKHNFFISSFMPLVATNEFFYGNFFKFLMVTIYEKFNTTMNIIFFNSKILQQWQDVVTFHLLINAILKLLVQSKYISILVNDSL